MKVLIIDDVSIMRRQLSLSINSLGFEFVEVTNFKQLERIDKIVEKEKPDVTLLDLNLFGWNGLDLIPKILSAHNTAIIVCSGVRDEDIVRQAINSGAIDYLVKPVDHTRLQHTLLKIKSKLGIR